MCARARPIPSLVSLPHNIPSLDLFWWDSPRGCILPSSGEGHGRCWRAVPHRHQIRSSFRSMSSVVTSALGAPIQTHCVQTSSNASVRPPPASLINKLPGWWTPVLEHWPESKPWDDEYRSATKAHLLAVIDANLALRCAQDSMQPSE